MSFLAQHRNALVFTLVVMVLATASYLVVRGTDPYADMMGQAPDPAIYRGLELKAARTEDGALKLFAIADPQALARLRAQSGEPVPTRGHMVLGASEAMMMLNEKLIDGTGARLTGFFGTDVAVGGILAMTQSPLDDLHFMDEQTFAQLQGSSDRIELKLAPDGQPKLFLVPDPSVVRPAVAEGSWDDFSQRTAEGREYLPIVLGASEAAMMRDEKLFRDVGDRIPDFFGTDVVIVGVLAPTNSSLDRMHLVPPAFLSP